jgi:hypothetical protein
VDQRQDSAQSHGKTAKARNNDLGTNGLDFHRFTIKESG